MPQPEAPRRARRPAPRTGPATLASNGKRCSSRSQKAWMVWIFSPPGVSIALAKRRRASSHAGCRARALPCARCAAARATSSSVTQAPSVSNTRVAMLAAAALVKVRTGCCPGLTPSSNRRITRWDEHGGLARAGIGRHPGRGLRIGRARSAWRVRRVGRLHFERAAHSPSPSASPAADHSFTRARWS